MSCKMKPLVYIASPYTKGDPAMNVRSQMDLFDKLLTDGVVAPYAPLWSHFQHIHKPRPYDDWLNYDLEVIIPLCNALLRVPAVVRDRPGMFYVQRESKGADREVERAQELGIKTFNDILVLYEWAKGAWYDEK